MALVQNTSFPVHLRRILEKNLLRFRKGVNKASQHWAAQTDIDEEQKVKELEKDIKNTPYHIFGQHSQCR